MASGSPWYAFRDRDGWRQGWFDDAVSLAPRLDFVRKGGYRGVAVFVLGYDNGELLGSIRAAFRGEAHLQAVRARRQRAEHDADRAVGVLALRRRRPRAARSTRSASSPGGGDTEIAAGTGRLPSP
jgi:hypothetical protein